MNTALQVWDGELSVITTPPPRVSAPTDVVVKVAYSGVCGTDLHVLAKEFPCAKSVVLGHEFSGVVTEIGTEVKHCSVGERVVINPNSSCGNCHYCFKGQPHFCPVGAINNTIGLWRNGGWAHFCRVPASQVHPIPTQITLEAAVFVEPISCILRGWDQLAPLPTDADILICGAGIIGLLFASIAHFRGYRRVILTEILEQRRALASGMKLGFNIVYPESLEILHKRGITNNDVTWGFDAIIDCTGSPEAIQQAFNWLRHGATFCIFGCCPKTSEIKINPSDVVFKEIKLVGSLINPFTFPRALQLVQDMSKDYLDYKKLGVGMFKLGDYAQALSTLKSGKISKAVFEI